MMSGVLDNLYQMKSGVKTKRASSYDRSGGNADSVQIAPRETYVMAKIEGTGIIKHIWSTVAGQDPMFRRNLVIRMFWDGEENPSVEVPLGDFFGQGWGEIYNFISLPLAAAPLKGNGLNSYFPMPFFKSARIEIENQSDYEVTGLYYYIDYEEHKSLPEDTALFHAWWNREVTCPEGNKEGYESEWGVINPQPDVNPSVNNNYVFADIEGKGHFVGVNYYVDSPTPLWYGEGDDMWLIDGEDWPGSLHGTGTEDFFNSSWCPNELYLHPYFGYARIPDKIGHLGRTHCYRFLIDDPIYFEKSLNASIEHGHANVLTLDISTVAYWYQQEPHKIMAPLPPNEKRQNMPHIGPVEIHRWRHCWQESMRAKGQKQPLWGNEDFERVAEDEAEK